LSQSAPKEIKRESEVEKGRKVMKILRRKPSASKPRRNLRRSQKSSSPEVVIKRIATFDTNGLTSSQAEAILRRWKFY